MITFDDDVVERAGDGATDGQDNSDVLWAGLYDEVGFAIIAEGGFTLSPKNR